MTQLEEIFINFEEDTLKQEKRIKDFLLSPKCIDLVREVEVITPKGYKLCSYKRPVKPLLSNPPLPIVKFVMNLEDGGDLWHTAIYKILDYIKQWDKRVKWVIKASRDSINSFAAYLYYSGQHNKLIQLGMYSKELVFHETPFDNVTFKVIEEKYFTLECLTK